QIDLPEGNDFVAIGAGGFHSLALKSHGHIVAWGENTVGQAEAPDGNDFVAVAAGAAHNLALKSDGSIVGWGYNYYEGNYCGQADPPDGNDFVAIAAGGWHSLALKPDGSIVGWGWNGYGQADAPDGNDFVMTTAGQYHSLALRSDGSIVGWGRNNFRQTDAPGGNDFVAIAAGKYHSLALAEAPPIELPMRVTPQALNCKSKGKWLKAHFLLAEGVSSGDVDTGIPAWIEPLGIESQYIDVSDGQVKITFDLTEVCDGLDSGPFELTVVGSLASGRQFYGTDTIKVID
ncbi:MAG: RCC1 domain-containing protein, partial [Planctomycetota bacterium]